MMRRLVQMEEKDIADRAHERGFTHSTLGLRGLRTTGRWRMRYTERSSAGCF